MCKFDIKDAYSHLKIFSEHSRYLRFMWKEKLMEYKCLPQGIKNGPFSYMKVSHEIVRYLRNKLIDLLLYIDAGFLAASNAEKLKRDLAITLNTLHRCGFILNVEKSELEPVKRIEFLGFILDTENMTIELTWEKRKKLFELINQALHGKKISIRLLAKIIGNIIATFPCSDYGKVNYRKLERFKINMLIKHKGKWSRKIKVDKIYINQLIWWKYNIFSHRFKKKIDKAPVGKHLFTDASNYAAGFLIKTNEGGKPEATGQMVFSDYEYQLSINTKELIAVKIGLERFD